MMFDDFILSTPRWFTLYADGFHVFFLHPMTTGSDEKTKIMFDKDKEILSKCSSDRFDHTGLHPKRSRE